MENEVKEDKISSLYLNIGDISDKPENSLVNIADSHHNKRVPYLEKVSCTETRKERDNVELGAGTLDGCKLFGVDLQMHSDSQQQLNSEFEMRVLGTSNTSISLTKKKLSTAKV